MKKLSFSIRKGGVGKTTMSSSVAGLLAQAGKKVLLVDADPQGNASCIFLKELDLEFADLLNHKCKVNEALYETEIENLYILPTNPLSQKLANYKVSPQVANDIFLIDDIFNSVANFFDFVIVDTSPDFSLFEKNLYFACDEIIPVVNADTFSSDGLLSFQSCIQTFKAERRKQDLKINTLIVNRFNKTMKNDSMFKNAYIDSNLYQNVFVIPQDQEFKNSQVEQRLIKNVKKETENILLNLVAKIGA